jgi:hypothetical protein
MFEKLGLLGTKIFRFEYWPWKTLYIPLLPYYAYLAFKNKSWVFPAHINLGLPMGGFFMEDKNAMLKDIKEQYLPKTYEINSSKDLEQDFHYPLVFKPVNAQRGTNVEKINSKSEAINYSKKVGFPFVAQHWVEYDIELAIVYHRKPGQKKGTVSSVTQKEFLAVEGDAQSSVKELLATNTRAKMVGDGLFQNIKIDLNYIPKQNEKIIIEPIGNHCRGTLFRNASHLDFNLIAETCDHILAQKKDFYFGRFDLKTKSVADLYHKTNTYVLELNGVNADPAHVFDPDYPFFKALRDIMRHWKYMSEIALVQKQSVNFTEDRKISLNLIKKLV